MALPSAQRFDGSTQAQNPFYQASSTDNFQNAPLGNPVFSNQAYSKYPQNPATVFAASNSPANIRGSASPREWSRFPSGNATGGPFTYDSSAVILPENTVGPAPNALPLGFVPASNLEEFLRFNITPDWIRKRWKRISTTPGEQGLHGYRVALVTGTNSWDLHGSLTYFFDTSQRLQRITFRGWAGDATQLTNLLTLKYGFRPHQTHWAGFYIAEFNRQTTGGLLMKHPAVIYTENPVQQVAVVLEINNPNDRFILSDDFHSLIEGSKLEK